MPRTLRHFAVLLAFVPASPAWAQPGQAFRFESVHSLDEMQAFLRSAFAPGAPRDALRKAFVDEGGGSLRVHPRHAGTEKYLYDLNLCAYYVWRWNISADYDESGRLLQAYVNGEPVHASGPQKKDGKNLIVGDKGKILRGQRPRPEASKGEKVLAYLMLDGDGDTATIDDQVLMGGGPTRPDPANMGKLIAYTNVDPWRSIFDADAADRVVDYSGTCPVPK